MKATDMEGVVMAESGIHPNLLAGECRRLPAQEQNWQRGWLIYTQRAEEAAELERRCSWLSAAAAWLEALDVATGVNVRWCRARYAWCLIRSR